MTRPLEPLDPAELEFEQRLFDSARADGPAAGATEQAWLKLAAGAAALTAAAPLAVPPGPRPAWGHAGPLQALKWSLIGALGGGALVALWLRSGTPTSAAPPARSAVAAPAAAAAAAVASPAPAAVSRAAAAVAIDLPAIDPLAPRSERSAPAASARLPERAARPPGRPRGTSRPVAAPTPESLLAREVAALDSARSALAAGASASARRQIEQYHRDFPAGELSADADVVDLEALAAEADAAALSRAAQSFLARHPNDPHAARIRELAGKGVGVTSVR